MSSFDDAFDLLIGNEGGYSNDPKDPGGETMWGVARAWGYQGAMRDLPRATAKRICKQIYWDPLHCDEFDPRVAFQILDANYNGGHAVLWMQQAAGVHADGKLGPATLAAVKAMDARAFVMLFLSYRIPYLTACKTWGHDGSGWMHRVAHNLRLGAA